MRRFDLVNESCVARKYCHDLVAIKPIRSEPTPVIYRGCCAGWL